MNCLLLGNHSDIAQGLQPLLEADGYKMIVWNRGHKNNYKVMGKRKLKLKHPDLRDGWDLAVIAVGSVAPVGLWWYHSTKAWEESIKSNLLIPMRLLRANWDMHNPGASICFLAGSNPNMIMDGYSAYNVGKMALLKACEQLDHETKDAKFFALNPGTILTKIHKASAFWDNPKLEKVIADNLDGSYHHSQRIRQVYECLKWCVKQPKAIIGGRNICTSDDWHHKDRLLRDHLLKDSNYWKLRRVE